MFNYVKVVWFLLTFLLGFAFASRNARCVDQLPSLNEFRQRAEATGVALDATNMATASINEAINLLKEVKKSTSQASAELKHYKNEVEALYKSVDDSAKVIATKRRVLAMEQLKKEKDAQKINDLEKEIDKKKKEYDTALLKLRNERTILFHSFEQLKSELKKLDLEKAGNKDVESWKRAFEAAVRAIENLIKDSSKEQASNTSSVDETAEEFAASNAVREPNGLRAFALVDAFPQLPLVKDVSVAESVGDFWNATNELDDKQPKDDTQGETAENFVCDHRFDAPAHFPYPRVGLNRQRLDSDGALIYEGMRFAVRDDGRYQIRFVVGTPAVPVTMRLQLLLNEEATNNRFTLTLPPIRIPEAAKPEHIAEKRPPNPVYENVQTIHQEGYLPVLASNNGAITVVRRTGTARFGFGVEVP